jgi:hypothetical protein
MRCHETSKVVQFVTRKAAVLCQHHGVKPKLGDSALSFHMNVRRLAPVRTEENEAIGAILKYGRHRGLSVSSFFMASA